MISYIPFQEKRGRKTFRKTSIKLKQLRINLSCFRFYLVNLMSEVRAKYEHLN